MGNLEVGDLVICTVDKIIGTNVFVTLNNGKEGTITFSEIAPGRIRNIRAHVVPKKIIVCKVLRISARGNIELSLRRVSQKERKEILEEAKQEKSYENILKTILGKKAEEIIKKIKEKENLFDFLEKAKEDKNELEKLIGKEYGKKIIEILKSQKKKKAIIKKSITLVSKSPDGLAKIKQIFNDMGNISVKYISAGNYSLKIESDDLKKADRILKEKLADMEKYAKQEKIEFSIKEK